jgi:hypothetical protein
MAAIRAVRAALGRDQTKRYRLASVFLMAVLGGGYAPRMLFGQQPFHLSFEVSGGVDGCLQASLEIFDSRRRHQQGFTLRHVRAHRSTDAVCGNPQRPARVLPRWKMMYEPR